MTTIYVAAEHHRVHWLWEEQGARDLRLCHVDFHCDMRGLLIDRAAQRATVYDPHERGFVDQGNFLMHAVMGRTVTGLRWVHDRFGGRRYDHGTVRYTTDLRPRMSRRDRAGWVPLAFSEEALDGWTGPEEGEHLDLDWDALHNALYAPAKCRALQRRFLDTPFAHRPEQVTFIYSYCSSHHDDAAFEAFLEALARKLEARVERLPPLPPEHSTVDPHPPLHRRQRQRLVAPFKRPQLALAATLKAFDTRRDLAPTG